jgi:hypothetical protein
MPRRTESRRTSTAVLIGGHPQEIRKRLTVRSATRKHRSAALRLAAAAAVTGFASAALANTFTNMIDTVLTSMSTPAQAALASTPYLTTPVRVPGTIEAENFDKGGQGVAYRDLTTGNQGAAYRTTEDVDVYSTDDSALGGGYVVKGFENGEWRNYTFSVGTAGNYNIELRAATALSDAAVRVLIDGQDVTGRFTMPNTGGWHSYQWVLAKRDLPLTVGNHVLRIVSEQQWFGLNSIRIVTPGSTGILTPPTSPTPTSPTPTSPVPTPQAGTVKFFCTFANSATDCGFREQAKVAGRATVVGTARDGSTAVRLNTQPGDTNVSGSNSHERNDLTTTSAQTDCYEGREQWWAHSTLFPNDFIVPPSDGTYKFNLFFQFHQASGSGQPPMVAEVVSNTNGGLRFRLYGGPVQDNSVSERVRLRLGPIQKNVWYDFVYHVKWSSGSDGFFDAWINGKKVLTHRGPTTYAGQSCYVKPSNYHSAMGQPNSVIHDRIIRGTTPESVARTPLEGVVFGN